MGRGVLSQTESVGHHSEPTGPLPSSSQWQGQYQCQDLTRGSQAAPPLAPTHHMPVAGQRDEDVAAFMDQQFAVDALVTMPRETPYPFAALATVRSL